jgi:hypothetical protein
MTVKGDSVANIALIVASASAAGTLGSFVVSQLSIKHVRKQAALALRQLHALRKPEWGDAELVDSGAGKWKADLPLISDTHLDSVRLQILVDPGQTAGLYLDGDDEGAPDGLALGEKATWRLRVNEKGDPTTRARVTSTAGKDKWSALIDLPFSIYEWKDITTTVL